MYWPPVEGQPLLSVPSPARSFQFSGELQENGQYNLSLVLSQLKGKDAKAPHSGDDGGQTGPDGKKPGTRRIKLDFIFDPEMDTAQVRA